MLLNDSFSFELDGVNVDLIHGPTTTWTQVLHRRYRHFHSELHVKQQHYKQSFLFYSHRNFWNTVYPNCWLRQNDCCDLRDRDNPRYLTELLQILPDISTTLSEEAEVNFSFRIFVIRISPSVCVDINRCIGAETTTWEPERNDEISTPVLASQG